MRPDQNSPTFAMSKRRRTGIIVLCLLVAMLLVWLDHSFIRHRWLSKPKSEQQARAYDLEKYHAKTFIVVNVIDGDTVDIDIPDGRYEQTRIRLLGVDAPETNSERFGVMYFGPQAAEFTKRFALGKPATVYLDVPNPTRDKYSRLLAYVRLPDDRFLNEVLLTEGFAYADLRFRHSSHNRYQQLEAAARSQKKGLWEAATHEELPERLQSRKPALLPDK
ncbi:MAG: thermonuclease family protein [Planctomycetota bacterium]|jgi:micrococcal nuclease